MRRLSMNPRQRVIIPGDREMTLAYAAQDWINTAKTLIERHGVFSCALSGGSTPKAIYEEVSRQGRTLDWSKILLFWSDERPCAKTDSTSNYRMAMEALSSLPIHPENVFPMEGLGDLEANAKDYETIMQNRLPSFHFDLMMLGMGQDGHTASLFPNTHGLQASGKKVIANFIPDKGVWRVSVTFECINESNKIVVYILGGDKAETVRQLFFDLERKLPIQMVGTESHPAFFVLDEEAASLL